MFRRVWFASLVLLGLLGASPTIGRAVAAPTPDEPTAFCQSAVADLQRELGDALTDVDGVIA